MSVLRSPYLSNTTELRRVAAGGGALPQKEGAGALRELLRREFGEGEGAGGAWWSPDIGRGGAGGEKERGRGWCRPTESGSARCGAHRRRTPHHMNFRHPGFRRDDES